MLSTIDASSGVLHPHQLGGVATTIRPRSTSPPPGLAEYLHSGCSTLPPAPPLSLEERWAAQLKHLASQHPLSAYNRAKYGAKGTQLQPAFTYVPLSIHAPAHVKQLQAQQAVDSAAQHWWPADDAQDAAAPPVLGPAGAGATESADLAAELEDAMQSDMPVRPTPVPRVARVPAPTHQLRTSESHPIHVSVLVPPELLDALSQRAQRAPAPAPTLFDVPPDCTLERLFWSVLPHPQHHAQQMRMLRAPPARPAQRRRSLDDAAELALRDARTRRFSNDREKHALPELRTLVPDAPAGDLFLPTPPPPRIKLGNLLLSSCPGKKVRLDGPVKGRGGVCRDLRADLARIRALGAACVVCCLDDGELAALGAPWGEYVRAAHALGLDVLRIPMPEGLAPLSPAALDARLARVLARHTLRGRHVLVHCRGGIGRAGLVACAWALRLGLCGWLETDPRPPGGALRRDTLALVERAVAAVRARRSPKAIETYEQVRFLVEYVDFLRDAGRGAMLGAPAAPRLAGEQALEGLKIRLDAVLVGSPSS